MPAVLLAGTGMLGKALGAYVAAFVFVAVLAKAAIVAIGLPDWVFPGALIVMALGLPVILFTAYVHRATRHAVTATPTFTPGGTPSAAHGTLANIAIKASPHVSWRRTSMGGVLAVGGFVVLIAAYMVLRSLGIGPFGSLLAAGALAAEREAARRRLREPLQPIRRYGPVVTEAFRTALDQSRAVGIVQPNELRDVLRRMQKPARHEGGLRRGARDGDPRRIQGRRRRHDLGARRQLRALGAPGVAADRRRAGQLAGQRPTARRALLPAIDKLAKDLRAKIGESLRSVQATPRLEQVTTPSLEALKKYVQGSRILGNEGDFERGAPLLEQAIALDTAFAMAYRRLAAEYSNRGQPDRADALLQKAFDHQDRLSDAERYVVVGSYYNRGPKQDIVKSTSAYESLIELQPDNFTALNNVAINYRERRDWAKAEDALRRGLATGNAPAVTHNQLIWTLWSQGRRDESWRTLAHFDSISPALSNRQARRIELLYASGQYDSAAAVSASAVRARPNDVGTAFFMASAAGIARTRGRLREAARIQSEVTSRDVQRGLVQAPVVEAIHAAASRVTYLNDPSGAAAILDKALAATPLEKVPVSLRPYWQLGLAYGMAGRSDRVREIAASFERSRREVTRITDAEDRHVLAASALLAERRYGEAAAEFRAGDQGTCTTCALPHIAQSYDLAGQVDSALAVYERYFAADDPFRFNIDQYFLAAARKRAGELYEARGDRQKALTHYLAFIRLFERADPELQPRVAEVRARVARLGDIEPRR